MLNHVKILAKSNKNERFNNLLKILENYNLKYDICDVKFRNHYVKNIVVPVNRTWGVKRFVLSAHYDNFDGSTAANDNSSGVAVLIKLAQFMQNVKLIYRYDVVFFDREEYEDRGSEQYIENIGKDNILGAINVDTCGFGNTIMLGPVKNLANSIFQFITKEILEQHLVQLINKTPGSDDRSFENVDIPNLSIGIVPSEDVPLILAIIECEMDGKDPSTVEGLRPPTFVETTHNGTKDNIKYVSENSMQITYKFLKHLIEIQNQA
ncbi:M28 family peptidase [Anaerocolumna sp. AGMB13025]|uniref:M28 family peptidase n=1 Tax=Anaerocolumna sp. AGMB13025 TaxID=3039116 RepID=UPI00241F0321|nr:M28 family peptidase [Anaerocolumna sp. AGMB13025]WFR57229.1 M28 family peptidase [Anaerocolumna sp. AGMB13025]